MRRTMQMQRRFFELANKGQTDQQIVKDINEVFSNAVK